jgi:hypothetical protein
VSDTSIEEPADQEDGDRLALLDELLDARGLRGPVDFVPSLPQGADGDVVEFPPRPGPLNTDGTAALPPYSTYTLEESMRHDDPPPGPYRLPDPSEAHSTTERVSIKERAADLHTEGETPPTAVSPDEVAPSETATVPTKTGKLPRGRAKRSSVPSWDEIVFGAPKTDN